MTENDHSLDGLDPDGPQSRPNHGAGKRLLDDYVTMRGMSESDKRKYC